MNKKYQNGFFLFGLLVLIIMASQLDFRQAWEGMASGGSIRLPSRPLP